MIYNQLIKLPKSYVEVIGEEIGENLEVSTDTRSINNENTFICLYGENFDAHSMLDKIIANEEIRIVIVEKKRTLEEVLNKYAIEKNISFIVVEDIFTYLKELARNCIDDWNKSNDKKIIGLTGSAGKTSTKEALFYLLDSVFAGKVLATKGNLNNHIGVPLTIFRLRPEHEVAIIEMGTNSPGEIQVLAEIASPNCGLITNVGEAHLEKLIDLPGVFQEKSSLYHVLNEKTEGDGIFIIPSDDTFLNQLKDFPSVITFGKNGHYQLIFSDNKAILKKGNTSWEFDNNILEKHIIRNLVQSFILVRTIFSEYSDEFYQLAKKYNPENKNRGQLIEKGAYHIYLDAYNANPLSMRAAVDTFDSLLAFKKISKENAVLVLGDMKELGSKSEKFHEELGFYILQKNFKNVFFVGEFGKAFSRSLESSNCFESKKLLIKAWEKSFPKCSHIFIKGSRALALEELVDNLPSL